MSQPNLLFCMYFHQLRTPYRMGLLQTTNKSYWRNFGCFRVFFVSFVTVLPAIFGERYAWFLNNKIFPTCNNFLFQDEMSFGTVSELFKHVPVHLKRLCKLWLWWEHICQSRRNYTNMFFFNSPEEGSRLVIFIAENLEVWRMSQYLLFQVSQYCNLSQTRDRGTTGQLPLAVGYNNKL